MQRSVVIRGSIAHDIKPNSHILKSIKSIRSWFDGEIVVSTWIEQKQFAEEIKEYVDKIVFLYDPGPGPVQNIVRQITSFKEGVNASSGEEILVTRSDVSFDKNVFDFLGKFKNKTEDYRVFEEKVLVGNIMTINPDSFEIPNTFRVSDWFHCGKRKDIEQIYSGLDFIKYTDKTKLDKIKTCTEKLWFLSILKSKYPEVDIYDSSNIDNFAWEAIVNNFMVLNSTSTLKTYNYNYPNQPENLNCYLTEEQYINYYNCL